MTPPTPPQIAICGFGKIARDQHLPSIKASPAWQLAATIDPATGAQDPDIPHFTQLDRFLARLPEVGAVAICTPPQARFAAARMALLAGRHVLLEKPPGATLSEVTLLTRIAQDHGCTLFTAWHSQFAPAVTQARALLAQRRILSIDVTWREDVRRWHPGQDWIFSAGGTGVFDPGINALSILTTILPTALITTKARLDVPDGRDAPIAVGMSMQTEDGATARLDFDFRETGPQVWTITIATDDGEVQLLDGGAKLIASGKTLVSEAPIAGEYDRIYARFAQLVARGESDVDLAPLQHMADAMLLGQRSTVAPFNW